MYIGSPLLPPRLSSIFFLLRGERRWANVHPVCLLRSAESSSIRGVQSIMQASLLVSMETIQVRLRSELFGLYQFRAHLVFFRPRSPSSTTTTCALPPLLLLFQPRYFSSPSPTAPRLLRSSFYVVEQSRAPSLLRGAEGFGKTWLSDRTAPLCYRRRISREPKG